MMFENESLLTLSQAAKGLPNRPHNSTLWRWCRIGLRDVRLEYIRIGGTFYTTEAALKRFGERLAAVDAQDYADRTTKPDDDRAAAIAEAEQETAEAGI